MDPKPTKLCAVLIGMAATPEIAAEHARISRRCPYASSYTSNSLLTTGVFVLPESKRWWIEVPAEQPELLGLEKTWLVLADCPEADSPWSRGETQPELEVPPCGANCQTCPQYRARCSGCPATQFFYKD